MLYFLIGVVFVVFALPILDNVTQLISSMLQCCTVFFVSKANAINEKMEAVDDGNMIGFCVSDESDYDSFDDEEDDDEDYDEDDCCRRKVGFN